MCLQMCQKRKKVEQQAFVVPECNFEMKKRVTSNLSVYTGEMARPYVGLQQDKEVRTSNFGMFRCMCRVKSQSLIGQSGKTPEDGDSGVGGN